MRRIAIAACVVVSACASSPAGDADPESSDGSSADTSGTAATSTTSVTTGDDESTGEASSSASSEGGETSGPALPGPGLAIVFPPSGATASATIVVRGTATHDATITGVSVNGIAAVSRDGFATWRVEVPLDEGDNAIDARMQTADGEIANVDAIVVTRFVDEAAIVRGEGFPFGDTDLRGMDIDVEAGRSHSADSIYDGVLQVELATGERTWGTCSESTTACEGGGEGVELTDPLDVAVVAARGQVWVADGDALFAVDLATKDRTVVSNGALGSGPAMMRAAGVAYDAAADRAYVLDWEGAQVLAIDPATGDRTLIASDEVGNGVAVNGLGVIEGDFARDRALLTRAYSNDIYTLDLVTGDREVLGGDGPALVEPSSIAVAPELDTAFVISDDRIFAIDLQTGARSVLAGDGPMLAGVRNLAFGRGLLHARAGGGQLAIDPALGHRVYVSR
ncbi:MAG TPA: hypothetical protein VG755_38965 [Nannocystaceae bacterium]|nr:hypothetical protein [Nannocystaceae bacterium]